jgi:hypothetical protein
MTQRRVGGVRAVIVALVAVLSSACGSSGSSGSSGGASTLEDTFCAKVAPCCASASLPTSGTACHALFAAFTGAAGGASTDSACIDALDGESQDLFCQDFGESLGACTTAFSSGGTVAPGGSCTTDEDCATSSVGTATCVFTTGDASAEVSVCVVEETGVAGSTPCNGTVSAIRGGSETSFVGSGVPASPSFLCRVADGLYCDAVSSTCVAAKDTGATCTDDSECAASDDCDGSGTCQPRSPIGGTCVGSTSCVAGAYCAAGTCATLLADGAACSTDDGCSSGTCGNAVCADSAATALALYCGGIAGN